MGSNSHQKKSIKNIISGRWKAVEQAKDKYQYNLSVNRIKCHLKVPNIYQIDIRENIGLYKIQN